MSEILHGRTKGEKRQRKKNRKPNNKDEPGGRPENWQSMSLCPSIDRPPDTLSSNNLFATRIMHEISRADLKNWRRKYAGAEHWSKIKEKGE